MRTDGWTDRQTDGQNHSSYLSTSPSPFAGYIFEGVKVCKDIYGSFAIHFCLHIQLSKRFIHSFSRLSVLLVFETDIQNVYRCEVNSSFFHPKQNLNRFQHLRFNEGNQHQCLYIHLWVELVWWHWQIWKKVFTDFEVSSYTDQNNETLVQALDSCQYVHHRAM